MPTHILSRFRQSLFALDILAFLFGRSRYFAQANSRGHAAFLLQATMSVGDTFVKKLPVAFVAVILSVAAGLAQSVGIQPFGTTQSTDVETVDLHSLNIELNIPVVSKTAFTYSIQFNNDFWYVDGGQWYPYGNVGWGLTSSKDNYFGSFDLRFVGTCGGGGAAFAPLYYIAPDGYHYTITPHGTLSTVPTCAPDHNTFFIAGLNEYATIYAPGAGSSFVTLRNGTTITIGSTTTNSTAVDSNGNALTQAPGNIFTNALGVNVLTITGSGTPTSPRVFTYPGPNGSVQITEHYGSNNIQTNFGCSGVLEYNYSNVSLPTDVSLPDGSSYSFAYEPTPGHSGYVTGRLKSITLPTGGTITYSYPGNNNGINCSDGTAAGLTRQPGSDGTWTYSRSADWKTTTVVDPSGNKSVYTFSAGTGLAYETQRQLYQGASTLLKTIVTCYNGNTQNCATANTPTGEITERDVYTTLAGMTQSSRVDTKFDGYKDVTEVKAYDFGSVLVSDHLRSYGTWSGSQCVAVGNGVYDRVCTD
jgi:hypothetical protein